MKNRRFFRAAGNVRPNRRPSEFGSARPLLAPAADSGRTALTGGFEKADPRSDRHVETFNGARHRNARQVVAALAGKLTKTLAFGTEHPRERPRLHEVVDRLFGFARRTHNRHARVAQLDNRRSEIRHRYDGHRFGGTRGGLRRGGRHVGRAVARHHDRLNARGVRNAQTRAEVARVGAKIKPSLEEVVANIEKS